MPALQRKPRDHGYESSAGSGCRDARQREALTIPRELQDENKNFPNYMIMNKKTLYSPVESEALHTGTRDMYEAKHAPVARTSNSQISGYAVSLHITSK